LRVGAAKQSIACGLFSGGEGAFIMVTVTNGALGHLTFAGAAGAIFTTIGQGNALPQGGLQNGFIWAGIKLFAASFQSNLVRQSHSFK
jgi:hypothetical protein